MTINVSLPQELEDLVRQKVDNGSYCSASELVGKALERFFLSDDQLSEDEITFLRETIAPRMEAIKNGTAELYSCSDFFDNYINSLSE